MVIATVGYLVAFSLHSLEWSAARGLAGARPADGSEDAPRLRVDLFGRLAIALTAVTLIVHVVAVVLRGVAADRAPWGNMYEFITSSLAFAVIVYLLAVWKLGARWLGLGVTLLGTVGLGLAVTVFYVDVAPLVPALHSVWFIVHIVAAAIAGAAFNVAAVAAILYLLKDRAEASGAPARGYLARLPEARRLDLFSYRLHAFAFPLWTFTIAAGAIWAQYAWGRFWNWDPKETWSFVTWVIYAAYLHARATAGWKGRPAAWIALVGVVSFWFNFIGVNLLFSGFHSYAGI
ncbi:c-type cytochrome biogenesis protein CcsB [Tessaracoccus rhinocerotis]|uniref:C-type cytochrome biogenesis protein CcsB n=2 Tax=Tessaracoccus rhinocerotis TaxID=1689449 RepID=A0A553K301_9ACTN|nr:c-type cytochrome biogenesis protein CcsB [Tessaracoccus rhinocerotis]TRY19079.1 c-type cytochrome biogenesis protein CcsB [Tessaracoccus rhinocerotis]